jgi:long-chain acyl-CoA synthetase
MDVVERTELAEEIGAVLHCAASISFDLPLEEARAINVEGTREMIGFGREAKALGRLERFLHVSTAYVAGAYPGTFRERQLVAGQEFRNTYEQTKWEAEQVVAAADDLAPAVVRPSIVMGESDSGWTPAFNVLYWPLRAFSRGLFDEIPALPAAHVDVVPVDYVADALVHILDLQDEGVFNLVAGRDAPLANELVELACDRFDRPRPEVVAAGTPEGDETGAVYLPYFDMDVLFDDARARATLGPAGIRPPKLADYFDKLIDYAELVRWGKRSMSREEAREWRAEEAEVAA